MLRPHPAISVATSAGLALGGGAAPVFAADAVAGVVVIRVGQADAFSRVEFGGAQPRSARREGDELVLRFGSVAAPNLSLLRVDPPRYLTTASARETPAGLELRLKLAPGVDAKVGRADGATYVNLSPGTAAPAPSDQKPDRRANPVPASGVVKLHASLHQSTLALRFDWNAPVGAAVFRRGEAIWIVFDAKARVDTSEVPQRLAQVQRIEAAPSADATVIRLIAPAGCWRA